MKIVIIGATGGTGSQLVAQALLQGHDVTAVARRPEAITRTHERLRVVKGDVLDPPSIEAAVAGADVVISAIGPANNRKPGTLISEGTKHMVAACERHGVRRIVIESGLMVGEARGLSWFGKMSVGFFRWLNSALAVDKRLAETTVQNSKLDWVIVRPVVLDNSPPKGTYKAGPDMRLDVMKKMSHTDVADFMLKAAADPALVGTIQELGH